MNITVIVALLIIPYAIVFYCALRHFDCFVKRIYDANHSLWTSLGKPTGWFWAPKDKNGSGWLARQRFISLISFDIPDWASSDPEIQRHWKLYHRYIYCGYAIIFVMVCVSASGNWWHGAK